MQIDGSCINERLQKVLCFPCSYTANHEHVRCSARETPSNFNISRQFFMGLQYCACYNTKHDRILM